MTTTTTPAPQPINAAVLAHLQQYGVQVTYTPAGDLRVTLALPEAYLADLAQEMAR